MTNIAGEASLVGAEAVDQHSIKGEMFGAVRLGSHARTLAEQHVVKPSSRWIKRRDRGPLLSRLDATERT
ncbi:MAG TPA: hypothetical protein VIP11_24340, partial [Gemmatimonadaceae bacterium]